MDTDEKIMFSILGAVLLSIVLFLSGFFYFSLLEAKRKDRELDIRAREIELKAEQYPYKTETKIEVSKP